jgi:hypothetical protein
MDMAQNRHLALRLTILHILSRTVPTSPIILVTCSFGNVHGRQQKDLNSSWVISLLWLYHSVWIFCRLLLPFSCLAL